MQVQRSFLAVSGVYVTVARCPCVLRREDLVNARTGFKHGIREAGIQQECQGRPIKPNERHRGTGRATGQPPRPCSLSGLHYQ